MLYGTERAAQCSAARCSEVPCSAAQRCCTVLYGAVWHHTQLCGTVQCCVVLYRAVWGCMVLGSAVQCTVLRYLQRYTMSYGAVGCCTVLQDVAQCYTRWYSAVNVQCYATYSATQCCRAL